MPRTKVSKSSKRNREVALREDKVREFESSLDSFLNNIELSGHGFIEEVEEKLRTLIRRTKTGLLQIKMGDFLEVNLGRFAEWRPTTNPNLSYISSDTTSTTSIISTVLRSAKVSNPNDEGYLTEDSATHSGGANSMTLVSAYTSVTREQHGRTPGPLSSARARRPRRSRSACGDYIVPGSALKPKLTSSHSAISTSELERQSRGKMRTPMTSRSKACSADRTYQQKPVSSEVVASPPAAFMRWPKPGEMVLSMCGSPVVAQVLPDKFANVNIPVKNGVLSLRPKKLDGLEPDFIESIDSETLKQIKTLHANLNLIVKMADKAIKE